MTAWWRRIWSRRNILVYASDLRHTPPATLDASPPVVFKVNADDGFARLATGDPEFELSARHLRELPEQRQNGEVCVSGWVAGDLAFYAWIQFRARRLARSTLLPIGPKRAFLYRALTVERYRGRKTFSAALAFSRQWLRDQGYERLFVDVDETNVASRKSIERAGFAPLASYRVHRVLWRRWAECPKELHDAVSGPAALSLTDADHAPLTRTSIEVVHTLDDLQARLPEWEALVRDAIEPNAFYEPFALLPALKYLRERARVLFVLVYVETSHDGPRALAGLFPFQRRRHYRGLPVSLLTSWMHRYCFLGTPLIHRLHVEVCLQALFEWYVSESKRWTLLELRTVHWGGPFREGLCATLARCGLSSVTTKSHQRALLEPAANADGYMIAAISKKRRKEYERLEKRLAEKRTLAYRVLDAQADPAPWIASFLRLEQSGWKGRKGSALAVKKNARPFFEEMATEAHRRGQLTMLSLEVDGHPIAMKCNLTSGTAAFTFKIAYDEAFASSSPGVLLELENIRHVHRLGRFQWVDSCTNENHPMFDRLWSERREIATVLVGAQRLPDALVRTLGWIRRRLKRTLSRPEASSRR